MKLRIKSILINMALKYFTAHKNQRVENLGLLLIDEIIKETPIEIPKKYAAKVRKIVEKKRLNEVKLNNALSEAQRYRAHLLKITNGS